jgi:putative ABC transport system permease protein
MAADPALPPTLLGWMVRGEWRANPVRTLVAVLAIAVGVALGFAVHLVNRSALAEFDRDAQDPQKQALWFSKDISIREA